MRFDWRQIDGDGPHLFEIVEEGTGYVIAWCDGKEEAKIISEALSKDLADLDTRWW